MSYANIAGLPSVWGLYGAFTPVLTYALFGSSRQLGVGPVAVTSLLISSGMQNIVAGADTLGDPNNPSDPALQATYNLKVTQLTFLVACFYTGAGRAAHLPPQHVCLLACACLPAWMLGRPMHIH